MRASPSGPAAALPAQPRDAVVSEKKIGLEFVEVGNFQLSTRYASEQGAQHRFFKFRGGRKGDIPQINSLVGQDNPKQMSVGLAPLAAHNASHSFLVGPDALDFDALADI